jgi:hypothetical protein
LKESFNFEQFVSLFMDIRAVVEHNEATNSAFNFGAYLLPDEGKEHEVLQQNGMAERHASPDRNGKFFTLLINETRDFMESADFHNVYLNCVEDSFQILYEFYRPIFFPQVEVYHRHHPSGRPSFESGMPASDPSLLDASPDTGRTQYLAKLLPLVTRSSSNALQSANNSFQSVPVFNVG